ncbi:hypothetical protein LCGC14_2296870 [marine sediment metagenome]|uniref:Uncharacterized protein n=1 Tax=marine sediment metagenome TaxID=412755 RepID=A0A0F9FJS9_9ZZZZ
MKFTRKYDWMYRKALANLRLDERDFFERWWNQLGEMIDTLK